MADEEKTKAEQDAEWFAAENAAKKEKESGKCPMCGRDKVNS